MNIERHSLMTSTCCIKLNLSYSDGVVNNIEKQLIHLYMASENKLIFFFFCLVVHLFYIYFFSFLFSYFLCYNYWQFTKISKTKFHFFFSFFFFSNTSKVLNEYKFVWPVLSQKVFHFDKYNGTKVLFL